jgi:hypothetical protein
MRSKTITIMFVENKKVRQLFGFHGMDTKSNEPYH